MSEEKNMTNDSGKSYDSKASYDSEKSYDSTKDTEAHIYRVRELLNEIRDNLAHRGAVHDASKLESPEKEVFDEMTPMLKELTYGSDEYKEALAKMKPALEHHYAKNSHHPEHYKGGVDDMTLLDVIEMLCDWKAAGERHKDGSLEESLKKNKVRFKIGKELHGILENTAKELGWI